MIRQKAYSLAAGIILFVLAAVFFISLLFSFLNVGSGGNAHLFFIRVGKMLSSVYGICSILIPVFLLGAGLQCFSSQWSFRKLFYLGCSPVPFFTLAVTEKLFRMIMELNGGPLYFIAGMGVITVSILIVAVEFLLIGILSDMIESVVVKQLEFKPLPACETPAAPVVPAVSAYSPVFAAAPDAESAAAVQEDEYDDAGPEAQAGQPVQEELPNEIEGNGEEPYFESGPADPDDMPLVSEVMAAALKPADTAFLDAFLARHTGGGTNTEGQEETDTPAADISADITGTDVPDEPITVVFQVPELIVPDEDDADMPPEEYGVSDVPHPDCGLYSSEEESFLNDPFDENRGENGLQDMAEDTSFPIVGAADTEIQPESGSSKTDPVPHDFHPDVFTETEAITVSAPEIYEEDDGNIKEDVEMLVVAALEPSALPAPIPACEKDYSVPAEGLLTSYPDGAYWIIDDETKAAACQLKSTLSEFKIEAEVTGIRKGPVITMFEILPAPGVKLSKIAALQDNIALRLAASSVRIVAPIPGKHAVGIEVPNKERAIVSFKEIIEMDAAAYKKMAVPVVLGKDITGNAQIIDLAKTPHLLIAGATGAGKSVCVNSIILSILYKKAPREVKLILIDPKIVELKLYNDIPHLLTPVITEPKRAFQSLQYCLCEMERRYALLDGMGVRDISSYNRRIVERRIAAEQLPYIVVIIDEFADLMATTGKELESTVARLAAMSRAVGIHLVLATQRPSIDVITGLIKANIPSRIAFMVASKTDSRIIIDQVGAEKLLGKGDMLYSSSADPFPVRIQGTFVSDTEVENVVEYVKQYGEPDYIDDEIFVEEDEDADMEASLFGEGADPLYDKALEIVAQAGKASASYIQRRLKIGYNRAARLVEEMEERGIVGPANGSKPREVIHIP